MSAQNQFDGEHLYHRFLGMDVAGESVGLVIDIVHVSLEQFDPLHLEWFSVP